MQRQGVDPKKTFWDPQTSIMSCNEYQIFKHPRNTSWNVAYSKIYKMGLFFGSFGGVWQAACKVRLMCTNHWYLCVVFLGHTMYKHLGYNCITIDSSSFGRIQSNFLPRYHKWQNCIDRTINITEIWTTIYSTAVLPSSLLLCLIFALYLRLVIELLIH